MADTSTGAVRIDAERKFYTRTALFYAAIILIGFTPSFYSFQSISWPRPNPPLTALTILHGLVFTAWIALLVVQTQLIAAGQRALHMRLGVAGFALAATMPALIYFTAIHSVPRGFHPPYATGEMWTALSLFDIPLFSLLIAMGWAYRREPQVHKRLMLIAGARMLEPSIGRMPIGPPVVELNYVEALLAFALNIGPLLWWDFRQMGKAHWVTKLGAVLLAVTYLARFEVWGSQGWHDFVRALPG